MAGHHPRRQFPQREFAVTLKYYFQNIEFSNVNCKRERGAVMYVTSGDVLKSDFDCIEAY
jgi:hypothetical protein